MFESFPELSMNDAMLLYNEALKKCRIISRLITELFDKADLILVDGKIELGVNEEKELCVIDSFGPDEFRTFDKKWLKSGRKSPPIFYDKEFIRTKLKDMNKNEYGKILHENGNRLIIRYKEITTRLYHASK
jgi:phosphoribosylaminoimidazole-succinocarboxamide synthase